MNRACFGYGLTTILIPFIKPFRRSTIPNSPSTPPGAVDYERIVEQWNGNVAEIGTEKGGTGTLRDLRFIGANFQMAKPLKLNGDVVNPFQQYKNTQSATAPGAGCL